VHVVSLQFKRLCKRIDRQYKQNMQKFATTTDGYTDGICPVGILLRVENKLQHLPQSLTIIPTEYDSSVFYRELQKHYS